MMAQDQGDTMTCRACQRDGRASEGRMCIDCGTFLCVRCALKGAERCTACEAKAAGGAA